MKVFFFLHVTVLPEPEKTLSDVDDEAGMQRTFSASFLRKGKC